MEDELHSRKSPWVFSRQWTDADKLLLCILMTHLIRDDIYAGCYGEMGRPNIQSLHELLQMETEELESHRDDIEALAEAYEKKLDVAEVLAERVEQH
jgi:hypothetical protein